MLNHIRLPCIVSCVGKASFIYYVISLKGEAGLFKYHVITLDGEGFCQSIT